MRLLILFLTTALIAFAQAPYPDLVRCPKPALGLSPQIQRAMLQFWSVCTSNEEARRDASREIGEAKKKLAETVKRPNVSADELDQAIRLYVAALGRSRIDHAALEKARKGAEAAWLNNHTTSDAGAAANDKFARWHLRADGVITTPGEDKKLKKQADDLLFELRHPGAAKRL